MCPICFQKKWRMEINMEQLKKDVLKLKDAVQTQRGFGNTSKLYLLGQDDSLDKVLNLIDVVIKKQEGWQNGKLNGGVVS